MLMSIQEYIAENKTKNEQWREQKALEREALRALSDESILRVTQEPKVYLRYLDVQAENPHYSASNILLAMSQNAEITVINSYDRWAKLGRTVQRDSVGLKIRKAETYTKDGKKRTGYTTGYVFDVKQTSGKRLPEKIICMEKSQELEQALKTLLTLSPVSVEVDRTEMTDAYYDPQAQKILIAPDLTDGEAFSALSREIVHARIHAGGSYQGYSRQESELDADSVSYMLCRQFGIPRNLPDVSRLYGLNQGLEIADRRAVLDLVQQIFRSMEERIQKEFTVQQRQHGAHEPTR